MACYIHRKHHSESIINPQSPTTSQFACKLTTSPSLFIKSHPRKTQLPSSRLTVQNLKYPSSFKMDAIHSSTYRSPNLGALLKWIILMLPALLFSSQFIVFRNYDWMPWWAHVIKYYIEEEGDDYGQLLVSFAKLILCFISLFLVSIIMKDPLFKM
jgi:hypothetical protein